MVTHYSPYQIS